MSCCQEGHESDPVRDRANALRDRLRKVPLSYFTFEDLEKLTMLLGPHHLGFRLIGEETLSWLEKIAEKFEKEQNP